MFVHARNDRRQRPQLVLAAVPIDQLVQAGSPVILPAQQLVGERILLQPLRRQRVVARLVAIHNTVGLDASRVGSPIRVARVRRAGETHERFVPSAAPEPIADGADGLIKPSQR
jgi:hypothetical protein